MAQSYRELDATQIIATLERLCNRIEERFPGAGLAAVGRELFGLARESAREAESLGRPNWPIRIGVGIAIGLMALVLALAAYGATQRQLVATGASPVWDVVQGVEAVINDVIFLGAAIFFLITIEGRLKRRIALRRMHQLRSIAHIVDMHQLTKDPERLMVEQADTASSPKRPMTRPEIGRYLDYCSELLALTGKVSALFVQRFYDPVVLQSVNEIEDLTNGLSRKVWQKITLLERPNA
jgi:hypothetical protein